MDKQIVGRSFARALKTYEQEAFVQRAIARHMLELVERYAPVAVGGRIFEFGCGTGLYSRMLLQRFRPAYFLLNDLCPEAAAQLFRPEGQGEWGKGQHLPGKSAAALDEKCCHFRAGDVEALDISGSWSLITSCSTLQWLEHPARFLARCRAVLSRGAVLAVSTFGPDTLREIRTLSGVGLEYHSMEAWQGMLEGAGFRLLCAEESRLVYDFPSPRAVLQHLKRTGVTGISAGRTLWTADRLRRFSAEYELRFPALPLSGKERGAVVLTYRPLYFVAEPAY